MAANHLASSGLRTTDRATGETADGLVAASIADGASRPQGVLRCSHLETLGHPPLPQSRRSIEALSGASPDPAELGPARVQRLRPRSARGLRK